MSGKQMIKSGKQKNKGMLHSVAYSAVFTILLGVLACIMGCASQGMNETEAAEADETRLETKEQAVQESDTLEALQPEEPIQRKLSVLGDSISTFETWIPEGYNCFYPENGELTSVEQTWWKMVLNDMEMELCANASSAGSTCVGDSLSTDNSKYGCSDFRMADLMGKSGEYPDIIIVYMGTNDFLVSIPLGDNDGMQYVEEGNIENFNDAYSLILDKLAANYPVADIFCCNLVPIGDWGTKREFEMMVNGQGLTSEDYSRRIEVIAAAKGCPVIDLQRCGITIDNMPQYVTDGVHLNPDGMELVRDAVEKALLTYYQ